MVNSVADGDDFLETLDLDSHDLGQMMGQSRNTRAKFSHEQQIQTGSFIQCRCKRETENKDTYHQHESHRPHIDDEEEARNHG